MSDNPYAPGASFHQSPPGPPQALPPLGRPGEFQFGRHIERGFNAFTSQWQAWLALGGVSFVVMLVAFVLCLLPVLIVGGPLSTGLYGAAFLALAGRPIGLENLRQGFENAGRSILGWIAVMGLLMAPVLIVYALFFAMVVAMEAGQQGGGGDAMGFFIGLFYLVLLPILMIWSLYFGVKTMFVMPLIAERGMDVGDAFRASWRASEGRFWWLLLFYFVVSLLMNIGVYACYVGLIATVPIGMCMIASAAQECVPPADSTSPTA